MAIMSLFLNFVLVCTWNNTITTIAKPEIHKKKYHPEPERQFIESIARFSFHKHKKGQ